VHIGAEKAEQEQMQVRVHISTGKSKIKDAKQAQMARF
jgi:hypothetical protein